VRLPAGLAAVDARSPWGTVALSHSTSGDRHHLRLRDVPLYCLVTFAAPQG
jgi:hypothetical protein